MSETSWIKSSYSGVENKINDCVELNLRASPVGIRDSKSPETGILTATPHAWTTFLTRVRAETS